VRVQPGVHLLLPIGLNFRSFGSLRSVQSGPISLRKTHGRVPDFSTSRFSFGD
jgi:hypothetical protein